MQDTNQSTESSCSYAKFFAGFIAGVAISFMVSFFTIVSITSNKDALTQTKAAMNEQDGKGLKENGSDTKPTPESPAQPTTDLSKIKPITPSDWVKGAPSAKISIIEFSDTECPFCKQLHKTLQDVVKKYDGKINWAYRHHPIVGLHSKSQKESEALECAGELGGSASFWKYTDLLYETTPANNGLDEAQLPKMAVQIGLNQAKFNTCLESGKHKDKISSHIKEIEDAGIQYTPFAVIISGDTKLPVEGALPQSAIEEMIDSLMKK